MGAGLERDVDRGTGWVVAATAAVGERRDLGMRAAELGVVTLADHRPAGNDDRADDRIRADPAAAELGELKSPAQVGEILGCGHGVPPD